jgi:hypothetical protein
MTTSEFSTSALDWARLEPGITRKRRGKGDKASVEYIQQGRDGKIQKRPSSYVRAVGRRSVSERVGTGERQHRRGRDREMRGQDDGDAVR